MKRVAIIGSNARVAQKHKEAIAQVEGVCLVATCDVTGHADFTDWRKMLRERKDIDLVTICTPNHLHAEQAKEVAEEFKREVLIEKPASLHPEDLNGLKNAEGVYAVLQLRPYYEEWCDEFMRQHVYSAALVVRFSRSDSYYQGWRGKLALDGGMLLNQGVHYVDLLVYFLRKKAMERIRVFGYSSTAAHQIETEDQFVGVVEFESGTLATVEVTVNCPSTNECSLTVIAKEGVKKVMFRNPGYVRTYRDILTGRGIPVREAIASLRVVEAFYLSAKTRKEVTLWV